MPIFLTVGPAAGSRGRRSGGGSTSGASARIQALIDGQLDAADLSFYDGTRPASTSTDPSGVNLLGTLTVAFPNGAPIANLLGSTAIDLAISGTGTVYVAGTATWCRMRAVDSSLVLDADVTTGTMTANVIQANTTTWTLAQTITPTEIRVTDNGTTLVLNGIISVA